MENKANSNYNYAQMFNSEVVKWRQIAAKLWSLLLILGVVLTHSVTANYNIITNFTGFLLGFFGSIFSIQFWLYSVVILGTFWAMFTFNDNLFRVTPKVYSNNMEKVLQNVYSVHSLCIVSNMAATAVCSYLLLKFYDQEMKLSYFYVCGFCVLSNFLMKFQFAFQEKYLLNWPIIEQTKYARFKAKVYGLTLSCLKAVLFHMVIWKIVYFCIGSCILNNLFSSASNEEASGSSFMTSFISMKLAFLLNLSHTVSWLIYEIYLTEIYHFNIQSNIHTPFNLPASMSLNTHAYIQTLAFIDFADISIYSPKKRQQLFSLSYTNNQPLNWLKVSNEALNLIKGFMEIFNFDDMLHGKVMNQPETPTRFANLRRVNNITSPLRDSQLNNSLGDLNYMKSPLKNAGGSMHNQAKETNQNTLMNAFSQKLIAFLKNKRMFSQLYKENTNYKTEQLFVDSFLVINALKGLSNLAMSSFTEDEYGIVQQTLPDIINTFIELQKILEKFNPSNTSTTISFKVLQKVDASRIELLMQKLTFILNESMFKITQTFGPSLKSLALSEEAMHRMKRFYLSQ